MAAVAGRVAVVADLLLEGDFIIGSPLKSTPHLIWPCHYVVYYERSDKETLPSPLINKYDTVKVKHALFGLHDVMRRDNIYSSLSLMNDDNIPLLGHKVNQQPPLLPQIMSHICCFE